MSRVLILLSLIPLPLSLHAQEPDSQADRARLRSRLDSVIESAVSHLPLAGASVVVLQGDDTLVARAAGYADLEHRLPASLNTVYKISSLTKQFTAAAILQQVERGVIRLDDDIAKYIPGYSKQKKRVTILQLLNHTSGIKGLDEIGDPFHEAMVVDLPQQDILKLIHDQPFDFEPGTRWSYSNTGYYLLGVILERVTGQDYASYIEEHLARPAGLSATRYCDSRLLIDGRAQGYDAVGVEFLNAPHTAITALFSAAGLCSTATDLVAWTRALQAGKVISRASYRTMTTPTGVAARASPPYGFGVWVIQHGTRRYISHLGQISGFSATLSSSSDSLIFAVLTNTSGSGATTLGGQLGSVIRGRTAPPTDRPTKLARHRGKPLTRAERGRYLGRYQLRAVQEGSSTGSVTVTLRVVEQNGRLVAQTTGDSVEELVFVGNDSFVAVVRPDLSYHFSTRQGQATKVRYSSPGAQFEGVRVSRD